MDNTLQNNQIKNVMDFYMIANSFKYISDDNKESIADHIYGSIILATALNQEYMIVDNVGEVIRTILLSKMHKKDRKNLERILNRIEYSKRNKLENEIQNYFFTGSKNGYLAYECVILENQLSQFFNTYLVENKIGSTDADVLYYIAKTHGVFDRIGDSEKNRKVFKFYYLNRTLKEKIRSGWDEKHLNINYDRIEKISEHVVGTIALAIALDLELDFNINLDEVISTLCIHEIGEIKIGDITPFDDISPEVKRKIEHTAMKKIINNLSNWEELLEKLFDFDDQKTEESKFAYYCDKLEADIQAKVYQDMGCHHPLTEQENNVVFKSSRVQQMVKDGAETAFDIWYHYDKEIYKDSPVFTKVLHYVKNNNINIS